MAKAQSYEPRLIKALEKFNECCNEIALIAMQHELHDSHISDVQDITRARTMELKKQVEHKQTPTIVKLSSIESADKKTDQKDDKKSDLKNDQNADKSSPSPLSSQSNSNSSTLHQPK